MNIEICSLPQRIIIGRFLQLPLQSHDVFTLWQQFRQEQVRKGILNVELFSIQEYAEWPPATNITHWAGIELQEEQSYPDEWKQCVLEKGEYACFEYGGTREEFPSILKHIIVEWLPSTNYHYDDSRKQFQIMKPDYSLSDSNATEMVCIPVCKKL